jgi:hypothetical protein
MAQATHGIDAFDDVLERHRLVVVGIERRGLHLLDQVQERPGGVHARSHHDGIHEEPDRPLELRAVPVRDWCADSDVGLA